MMTQDEQLRAEVAYLMWCIDEGYLVAEDRALLGTNWLLDDPSTLTADDRVLRVRLLAMADEVITAVRAHDAP